MNMYVTYYERRIILQSRLICPSNINVTLKKLLEIFVELQGYFITFTKELNSIYNIQSFITLPNFQASKNIPMNFHCDATDSHKGHSRNGERKMIYLNSQTMTLK